MAKTMVLGMYVYSMYVVYVVYVCGGKWGKGKSLNAF